MSESRPTHTLGPWRVVTSLNEEWVGVQMGMDGGFSVQGPNAEANGRLIAAAPDLLAACKRALEEGGALNGATRRGEIRAAIQKAECDEWVR